jgi:hypothetical protein
MKFEFNRFYPDANNEQKWEQIRLWRNAELANTDWTQLADAPVDAVKWATYRQSLRDLPSQEILADDLELPKPPKK